MKLIIRSGTVEPGVVFSLVEDNDHALILARLVEAPHQRMIVRVDGQHGEAQDLLS